MGKAPHRVVVIGAGIGGLVTALLLSGQGLDVTLCERAAVPGGKMRRVTVDGADLDAGPTVFTMRWVFEEIFHASGTDLAAHVTLRKASVLARHAWSATERLDLFADPARSADAIGVLAGAAEAQGFLAFCERARRTYQTLEGPFIRGARPTALSLVRDAGLRGIGDLWRIAPFESLWNVLGTYFKDRRLRQLFGRYATYCGSSPFLAPATLMLVAHVEQDGVWLVEGGMHRLATALADLATARGTTFRYGAHVEEVLVGSGRAAGVRLAGGERIDADAVVVNADAAALAAGFFGRPVRRAVPPVQPADRSLSAVTWAMRSQASGFSLSRHNVFFSDDYAAEFDDLLVRRSLPRKPTVYVCAQDRSDDGVTTVAGPERLLCLVNAPPIGDVRGISPSEESTCKEQMFRLLENCGLTLGPMQTPLVTGPAGFERLFPATGGGLYGQAVHGSRASFQRPGSRSRIPGLYLAGGSTHPGAGVPMAALSGRLAAASVIADLAPQISARTASTAASRPAATRGGMSMR